MGRGQTWSSAAISSMWMRDSHNAPNVQCIYEGAGQSPALTSEQAVSSVPDSCGDFEWGRPAPRLIF